MNTVRIWVTVFILIFLLNCQTSAGRGQLRFYDLNQGKTLSESQAVAQMGKTRIVLVGEHHNNRDHHQAQLEVIQALHRSGKKVVVGMEMFRKGSQGHLDQWVAGELDEDQFKPIFNDNWSYGWQLYRPIFEFARQNRIPMVGLNVPRRITSQVAYHGFASLNSEQRGVLEGITCNVTLEYREFIKRAYGAHAHGQMDFTRFCEAQLVWDTAMAMHAVEYLEHHPDAVMVLIAGSGHARKLGIPTQLDKITPWAYAVVLPETEGVFDAQRLTIADADYILLSN